jgi:hypothetical protein
MNRYYRTLRAILVLCGIDLIIDGVSSLYEFWSQPWWFQVGRVIRIPIALFLFGLAWYGKLWEALYNVRHPRAAD